MAGMWRRNAVITMRYARMHGISAGAIQALAADKCARQSKVGTVIIYMLDGTDFPVVTCDQEPTRLYV
jgi:hypothetical protein